MQLLPLQLQPLPVGPAITIWGCNTRHVVMQWFVVTWTAALVVQLCIQFTCSSTPLTSAHNVQLLRVGTPACQHESAWGAPEAFWTWARHGHCSLQQVLMACRHQSPPKACFLFFFCALCPFQRHHPQAGLQQALQPWIAVLPAGNSCGACQSQTQT